MFNLTNPDQKHTLYVGVEVMKKTTTDGMKKFIQKTVGGYKSIFDK